MTEEMKINSIIENLIFKTTLAHIHNSLLYQFQFNFLSMSGWQLTELMLDRLFQVFSYQRS